MRLSTQIVRHNSATGLTLPDPDPAIHPSGEKLLEVHINGSALCCSACTRATFKKKAGIKKHIPTDRRYKLDTAEPTLDS